MTKYTFEDKRNVVAKYINENKSTYRIRKETGISERSIIQWIRQYEANGISALAVKHLKREYDLEFKKRVVDYYLNSKEGTTNTAIKFGIHISQVYQWHRLFEKYGISGLIPSPKGRPRKLNSNENAKKHINRSLLPLSEKEKYEEEILRLKNKLHRYELEHDILKAYAQIKKEETNKKRK